MNRRLISFCKQRLPNISYPIVDWLDKQKYELAKKQFDNSHLIQFKNCAKHRRCFIVATGPSLTLDDVNALQGEDCFSVNSIFQLFSKTKWRPKYYCVADRAVWEKLSWQICKFEWNAIFYPFRSFDVNIPNSYPLLSRVAYSLYPNSPIKGDRFSLDATKMIYTAQTVVYVALQLAITMGYREIYLLGTDCNYRHEDKRNDLTSYPKNVSEDSGQIMIASFDQANKVANQLGVKIINVTRGGMLEVFPRMNLEDVL